MELVTQMLKGFLLVHESAMLVHVFELNVRLIFAVENISNLS